MTWAVRDVEAFSGEQIIVWLKDEQTGADGPGDGSQWCVRIKVDEAPKILGGLVNAYAICMQKIVIDLASGPCRTCGGERKINVNHLARLMGQDGGGEPCPVCTPRAEKRLRKYVRWNRA